MQEKIKLFLDDDRMPKQCYPYMYPKIGNKCWVYNDEWFIVRSYKEFVEWIMENGLPDLVSFDHDLADEHYGVNLENWKYYSSEELGVEKTGYDCARWLMNYCADNGKKLPEYLVHSANTVGAENITKYLENGKIHLLHGM